MSCPGSMVLSAGKPDTSSHYADEGTAAHELASWCLEGWTSTPDGDTPECWPKPASAFLGRVIKIEDSGREFTVDEDMARDVQQYLDNIAEYALGADAVLIEVRVNYSDAIGVPKAEGWGTSDVVILKGDEVQVHDLKFGRGEQVEAEDNPQCQLYALGALAEYDGVAGDFARARMVIHQVRTNPRPIEWDCTVEELKAFGAAAKLTAHAVKAAEFGAKARNPEWDVTYLQPGEKACRWCKAKATCPALRDEVADTMGITAASPDEFDDADIECKPEDQDNKWLSVFMRKAPLVELWLKAVRAEVERRLLAGTPVDGYKLVQGKRGNRAWSSTEAAETLLKSFRLKQEQMYDFTLISPTVAEKLLKDTSPKRWKKAQELVTQSEGGKSVAPVSDKRPAIVVTPVADEFPDMAGDETFDDLA